MVPPNTDMADDFVNDTVQQITGFTLAWKETEEHKRISATSLQIENEAAGPKAEDNPIRQQCFHTRHST